MAQRLRFALGRATFGAVLTVVLLVMAVPAWAAVTANDDAAVVAEDTPVDIPVLVNDLSDGSSPVITAVSAASSGATSIVGSTVRYAPNSNFSGSDTFTYDIEADGFTDTATVFVTVIAVNDAPIAVADVAVTAEEAGVSVAVLANDSDPDGNPVTLVAAGAASFGSATVTGSTVSYLPNPDYFGPDLFTYNISDGVGGVATGVVSVTVTPVNDPPVATADATGTFRDTPVAVSATANDTDIDGDAVSIIAVGSATNGTASIGGPGSITYVPALGFVGVDAFTYTITDPSGETDSATITVTVSATNHPPSAVDDFATTGPETAVVVAVLSNDVDADGDPLTVLAVGSPARGGVVLNGDNTVTYTPEAGFAGLDAFSYTAGDGLGGTDSGIVTVSVAPASGAPTLVPDSAIVPEDGVITIDVLANDTGDLALAVQSVSNAVHGTVALQGDGTVRYSPEADYHGPDSFTYVATDLSGASASALVTITVSPVNDSPVALQDKARSEGGVPSELNLLTNDSDVDGDTLTVRLTFPPTDGTVTFVGNGVVRYTPHAGFVGVDLFQYEACDAELCTSAIVTIDVTAPAPLPSIVQPPPPPAASLPQLSTQTASPPLAARPVISPSIGLAVASSASLESLRALLLPLTMLGVVMVWVLSANNFPLLFFWRRKRKEEPPSPIG